MLARSYDPQIGRFLGIDPLADAGGQQVWSPYAAMGNAPESMVDPKGTISSPMTDARFHGMGADPMRTMWTGFSPGTLAWMGIRGDFESKPIDVGWKTYVTTLFGNNARVAFANATGRKYYPNGIVVPGMPTVRGIGNPGGGTSDGDASDSPNDEQPVKFLNDDNKVLNDVFDHISYNKGDNIFCVMGHGNTNLLLDQSDGKTVKIRNAHDFDEHMSAKSPEYKDAIENNKPFMLWLYVCTSSELAQQISQAHPNATILGANGVVNPWRAIFGIVPWPDL